MKIGLVTDLRGMERAAALGFDYIEAHVTEIAALDDGAFEALIRKNRELPVKIEACCVLLPGDVKVTGPAADSVRQANYLERAFARLGALGVKIAVFGSGGARRVPEGFDRAEAWRQLVGFGRLLADTAARYGLTAVIEPLYARAANMITTQLEAVRLAEAVDRSALALLCDYFHLYYAGEGRAEIAACGARLRHAHIPNPAGRFAAENAGVDYEAFFAGLADCAYCGRLSLEDNVGDASALLPDGLALLREKSALYGL